LITASYAGRESQIAFFYLAPLSMHKARVNNDAPIIDPVVGVDLSTPMLHAALKALRGGQLPEDWK
jgi:hypothetical protein